MHDQHARKKSFPSKRGAHAQERHLIKKNSGDCVQTVMLSELFTLLRHQQILHRSIVKPQTEPTTSGYINEVHVSLTHGDLPSVKSK